MYSSSPDEEEQLLGPDFTFQVRSCDFDTLKKKWIIYLSANELLPFDIFMGEALDLVVINPDRFAQQVVPLQSESTFTLHIFLLNMIKNN